MAQTTPVPHTRHDHDEEDHTVKWEKRLKWLAPGSAAVLLLAVLFLWIRNQDSGLRNEVAAAYAMAQSAEDLEGVAQAYPKQPEAPLALLQAASMRFNDGEIEPAQNLYQSFLDLHPSHPLRETAEWGLWMCLEQTGDLETALSGFASVSEEQLLYPQALMAQARIQEKQDNVQAALDLYTQIEETFPQSPWAEQARVFRDQVGLNRE